MQSDSKLRLVFGAVYWGMARHENVGVPAGLGFERSPARYSTWKETWGSS